MKKRVLLVLLLILAISVTACRKAENASNPPEQEAIGQAEKEEEVIPEDEPEAEKYQLYEIENFDRTFDTIYGITDSAPTGKFYVFADEGAYLMSRDKIYTNGTHFNLD